MESLFKNHIGPLLIIFIVGLALANVVIAKEYSVADIDKAAFANDMATPEYASVYGPKVGLEMALATDYGKDHPVVYMLQGMNLYNTPEQYGGSKERALTALDRAIELYEEAEQGEHWGMMDALSWRGQAHLALGNKEAARKDFQKALTLSPQNAWVQGLLASMN